MRQVVLLINEFADRPRAAAGEQDMPYPDLTDFPDDVSAAGIDVLVSTANASFEVFAAAPDLRSLTSLNTLLRSANPVPVATADGTRWVAGDARKIVYGAVGICLLEWLDTHGRSRMGLCDGTNCTDVYADASPAGSRRFCSATCLNRHKVAAHRSRNRRS